MWALTAELGIYTGIGLAVYVIAMAHIAKRQREAVLARLRKLAVMQPNFEQTCWAVDEALRREYGWISGAVGFPLVFFGCLAAWPLIVFISAISALVAWADARRRA